MKITFKKLDSECFFITDGNSAINAFVRYSKANKHYCIDAAGVYMEVNTISEFKQAITNRFHSLTKFEI